MEPIFHETKQRMLVQYLSPLEQPPPYFPPQSPPPLQPPPQSLQSNGSNFKNKVSPSLLLIIIILAIIFFVSGLVHLLIRFLLRPSNREPGDSDHVTALQGQLQQLFHLHDAGVDQSLIDYLPVFHYKSIIGLKHNPFDCAVCLCGFEVEDKLRLLPICSHAFHMECIDTWLLSHSTCPLCRASLIIVSCSSPPPPPPPPPLPPPPIVDDVEANPTLMVDENIVPVKLGKFRNVDNGIEGCSGINSNVDSRRCFSMGSFEYVMDENSFLQVPIRTPLKKPPRKKLCLPLTPGHHLAMSECDCESRRGFNGFETTTTTIDDNGSKSIRRSNKESFSISKIWLRGKKGRQMDSSRRAFSFRLKVKNGGGGDDVFEMGSSRWGNGGGSEELGLDEENQRCHSLDDHSQGKTPSFARRTMLWLGGRQNKVVHSSFSPNM
ncbi:hypothetical protein ES319_D08G282000v1 [Gossypium barbadense]|uniref:RING-type E3 ubiquitin transferase n=1 Tax=Gossypium barbadense TaxID=3634 RepID=A0A5J5QL63_GOSBA|nr:hypothetical protein ES319_D08G282000v1 [Gossypium barbadense]